MIFVLGTLELWFPFEWLLPEQIQLIYLFQKLIIKKQHGIITIPPINDFPLTLISFVGSINRFFLPRIFFTFCVDSNIEIQKILLKINKTFVEEKKRLKNMVKHQRIIAKPYYEKHDLCLHPSINSFSSRKEVDDFCISLNIGHNLIEKDNSDLKYRTIFLKSCFYSINFKRNTPSFYSDKLFTINHLREVGFRNKICPYFLMKSYFRKSLIKILTFDNFFDNFFTHSWGRLYPCNHVLLVDNGQKFFCFLDNLQTIHLNSIQVNDSLRGIYLIRKKILGKEATKSLGSSIIASKRVQKKMLIPKEITGNKESYSNKKFFMEMVFSNNNLVCNQDLRLNSFLLELKYLTEYISSYFKQENTFSIGIKNVLISIIYNKKLGKNNIESIILSEDKLLSVIFSEGIFQVRFFSGLLRILRFLRTISSIFGSPFLQNIILTRSLSWITGFVKKNLKVEYFDREFHLKFFFEKIRCILILLKNNQYILKFPFQINYKLNFTGITPYSDFYGFINRNEKTKGYFMKGIKNKQKKNLHPNNPHFHEEGNNRRRTQGIIYLFENILQLNNYLRDTSNEKKIDFLSMRRKRFFETPNDLENLKNYQNFKISLDLGKEVIYFCTKENQFLRIDLTLSYHSLVFIEFNGSEQEKEHNPFVKFHLFKF